MASYNHKYPYEREAGGQSERVTVSVEVEGLNQVGDALFLALKMRGSHKPRNAARGWRGPGTESLQESLQREYGPINTTILAW